MAQCYQDAMAVACYLGKIDYFIMMTTNPKWHEIQENLLPGQSATDCPDLVSRVFHAKQQQLLDDITKNGIFGWCVAHVYTIEFQKWGLPHMHLLVILDEHSRCRTLQDVDNIISAEFPDRAQDLVLYELVLRPMAHGPCDARCLDKNK